MLSRLRDARHVNEVDHTEPNTLILEVHRYLVAVDTFRVERCEPTWLPESAPCRTPEECVESRAERLPSTH